MTVEPKRQKRPYSYYEKTINEYSYRSMERVSKTCPEKVEALLLRFPFDDSQDKQLRRALRRCRIYPGQGCYDDCYSAAKVDGTSNFKYLLKIMIPIAMPTLITITILKLMGSWNAYVWPTMVTQSEDMRLISNGLRNSFSDSEGRSTQGRQMAAATAVLAPLLIMFIFLRKYIMRGVSRSGIKG